MNNQIEPTQDPLFDSDPDFDAINAAADAKRRRRLILAIETAIGPGPVYQGVSKEIRRLTATGQYSKLDPVIDATENAGTIAAARALARAIDKATGHNLTGWNANGRDLSPMFEQLRELMARLHPSADPVDEFDIWLTTDEPHHQSAHP